jgi:hypothetical protein
VLFGRGQNTLEAHHEQVADQVGTDILGTPAHVFLLEPRDSGADGGFDLSLCLHGGFASWGKSGRPTGNSGLKTRLWVPQTR